MKKIAKAIKTVLIAVISLIINIVTFPIQGIVLLVFTLTKQPDKMYEQMLDDSYFVFDQIYDKPYYLNKEQYHKFVEAIADYQIGRLNKLTLGTVSIMKWQSDKLDYAPANKIWQDFKEEIYYCASEALEEAGVTPAA